MSLVGFVQAAYRRSFCPFVCYHVATKGGVITTTYLKASYAQKSDKEPGKMFLRNLKTHIFHR